MDFIYNLIPYYKKKDLETKSKIILRIETKNYDFEIIVTKKNALVSDITDITDNISINDIPEDCMKELTDYYFKEKLEKTKDNVI